MHGFYQQRKGEHEMRKYWLCTILCLVTVMLWLFCGSARAERYIDRGDGSVEDTETGLIWQQTDDGSKRKWADAEPYCNDLSLTGHDDWRLPRIDELMTIIDFTRASPALDPIFEGHGDHYWSETTDVTHQHTAWRVWFGSGRSGNDYKDFNYYVRCVREGPFWPFDPSDRLVVDSGVTIRDTYFNLMWQKGTEDTLSKSHGWHEARQYCEDLDLGGYSDWRLPEIEELAKMVDYNEFGPAWSKELFRSEPKVALPFWANTESVEDGEDSGEAWIIHFWNGDSHPANKYIGNHVRCVRGGAPEPSGTLTVMRTGTGDGTVTSKPAGIVCGDNCTGEYSVGRVVRLMAWPDGRSRFNGWSGGCSGKESECQVMMTDNVAVTAEFAPAMHSISGAITTGKGVPVGSVTVSLEGAVSETVSTTADGKYSFIDLPKGIYSITPSKPRCTFWPATRTVNLWRLNVKGKDFSAVRQETVSRESVSDSETGEDGIVSGEELNAGNSTARPSYVSVMAADMPVTLRASGRDATKCKTLGEWIDNIKKTYGKSFKTKSFELVMDQDMAIWKNNLSTILLPSNTMIRMESGSRLKGPGKINFGGGSFSAPPVKVFDGVDSVVEKQTGRTEACHAEWFGARARNGGGDQDDAAIQKCLDVFNRWDGLQNATYDVDEDIVLTGDGARISGNGAKLVGHGSDCAMVRVWDRQVKAHVVTNVNISDLSMIVEGDYPGVLVKNACNVDLHDLDITVKGNGAADVAAITVQNSSGVSLRSFMLANEHKGFNQGVLLGAMNDGLTVSPFLNNVLLDTGAIKNFKSAVDISIARDLGASSWSFLNLALLDESSKITPGSAAIRVGKEGVINNINVIGCRSNLNVKVFDVAGAKNNPRSSDMSIMGFDAINPGMFWSNKRKSLYSYWIGAAECSYYADTASLNNPLGKYYISSINETKNGAKLLNGDILVFRAPGSASFDGGFKNGCIMSFR